MGRKTKAKGVIPGEKNDGSLGMGIVDQNAKEIREGGAGTIIRMHLVRV